MKKVLFYAIVILSFYISNSQVLAISDYNIDRYNELQAFSYLKSIKNDRLMKDIYLFKNWDNKGLININKKKYLIKNINYNVLDNQFETKISEDSIIIYSNNVEEININGKKFKNYYLNHTKENQYCEVMFEGKELSLIKQYYIKVREAKPNPLMVKSITDEFVKKNKYYIVNNITKTVYPIRLKKKDILGLIKKEKRERVENFVLKEKLSYKKAGDLYKILKYSESLKVE